ncbi:hypothetical protein BpHYR1_049612 [Brachionus plicatilis]|uniref:Uncharacterized protein n=1 Tax=Brachionus plicatilis TaxID=10195 RepID=A0A3M7QDU4_BRAPC|nr:hypothetical protein BpHYR1_049612 [Brachionus plicatilis]
MIERENAVNFFNGCIGPTILRLLSLYLNNFGTRNQYKILKHFRKLII